MDFSAYFSALSTFSGACFIVGLTLFIAIATLKPSIFQNRRDLGLVLLNLSGVCLQFLIPTLVGIAHLAPKSYETQAFSFFQTSLDAAIGIGAALGLLYCWASFVRADIKKALYGMAFAIAMYGDFKVLPQGFTTSDEAATFTAIFVGIGTSLAFLVSFFIAALPFLRETNVFAIFWPNLDKARSEGHEAA